jgi:hypothetical protein
MAVLEVKGGGVIGLDVLEIDGVGLTKRSVEIIFGVQLEKFGGGLIRDGFSTVADLDCCRSKYEKM